MGCKVFKSNMQECDELSSYRSKPNRFTSVEPSASGRCKGCKRKSAKSTQAYLEHHPPPEPRRVTEMDRVEAAACGFLGSEG